MAPKELYKGKTVMSHTEFLNHAAENNEALQWLLRRGRGSIFQHLVSRLSAIDWYNLISCLKCGVIAEDKTFPYCSSCWASMMLLPVKEK